MGNDPKNIKEWLKLLPQKKIVIYDDDKGGRKLKKYGDCAFSVPEEHHDLGDMTNDAVFHFLQTLTF